MPSYSRGEVVLVQYPFHDLTGSKVRPAVVVSAPHVSQDVFTVPLTSRVQSMLSSEFQLADWKSAGLNVPSAIKRGIYVAHQRLILKSLGHLARPDAQHVDESLRAWLGLS